MSSSLSPASLSSPVIPQPLAAGDIVGMVLQNTGGAATAATEVTFGQVFQAGAVAPGAQLYATVTGTDGASQPVAVQMDAKTFNPDGSVATAVLTMQAPALAADSSTGVMLSVGPALATAPPLDLAAALNNYSLTVDLAVQSGTATAPAVTNYHIDAVAALKAALAGGTASYWLQGANASQARVIVPVTRAMQMVFDITANADGTFSTDVQFRNDQAWVQNSSGQILTGTKATDTGWNITYNETITQNGAIVSQQNNIKQYQYQNWHSVVGTQPSIGQINIQHDVAYLEAAGAVQNYDLTTPIPASDITGYAQSLASKQAAVDPSVAAGRPSSGLGSAFGAPLSNNGVDPGMGGTGGRPDIGPTTGYNSDWLMTQNATAAQYALAQADAAGAVPWNMQNGTMDTPLTTQIDPQLWTDSRGGPYSDSSGLVINPNNGNGWNVDMAHQPALSYDAALLTGSRYYLNEAQNQAAYAITAAWPGVRVIGGYSDIVVWNTQVRASAWSLRDVINAAYLSPAGSAEKAYFTKVMNDNLTFLISEQAQLTAQQGQAYGYLPGGWGNSGGIPPWQEDYFYSTIAQAALQGNAQAVQIMGWMDNFIVGRFLAAAQGFLPQDGIGYFLNGYDPASETSPGNALTATYYKTWAQIEQATIASGNSNGANPNATGWAHSQGDYGQLALVSLADTISVFGTTDQTKTVRAIQAYGWLLASGAPYLNPANAAQFSIDPRLADGKLLTHDNILISNDAAGSTNILTLGTNSDQLIHAGAGNDTLAGGTGINLLFAGAGNDVLIGGPSNDYLYGGSGTDTLSAGAGANYMQAGIGATTFILNPADTATDTINNFKIGTDQLGLTSNATAADIQAMIAGATTDQQGNAVLHLSPQHSVTLQGITLASLIQSMFESAAVPVVPVSPVPVSSGGLPVTEPPVVSPSVPAGQFRIDNTTNAAPAGIVYLQTDTLSPGQNPVTLNGVGFAFSGAAQIAIGSKPGIYAAPYVSADSGASFNQANGYQTSEFFSTGKGSVEMTLPGQAHYLGLLWGSVDASNTLSFYNGSTLVGTVSGAEVMTSPDGNRTAAGSVYVNITSATAFDRVVASNGGPSFEFGNVAYSPDMVTIGGTPQGGTSPFTVDTATGMPAPEVQYVSMTQMTPGTQAVTADGIGLTFSGGAQIAQGNKAGIYAAPVLTNNNGDPFGNTINGQDQQAFLSTYKGSITMTLPGEEKHFGLLWGSVDSFNKLSFYQGNTLVDSVIGSQVLQSANGSQSTGGSVYVNINSSTSFDRIVATSASPSFEFTNLSYAANETDAAGVTAGGSAGGAGWNGGQAVSPFSSNLLGVGDITSQSSVIAGALTAGAATTSSASTAASLSGYLSTNQQSSATMTMLHAA